MEEESRGSEKRFSGRPRRGPRRISQPIPVKEGEEYDVTIETIGRKGDGIAKVQNFIIFVPETRAGDRVKVRITGIGASFATATVVK
ncbi:TRAM domain-containing protein [Candidatus Bathyarchaeota archaeon]|nr:TRAM domain-containing protein [Candidatus Bathyarchaeota archaeon]